MNTELELPDTNSVSSTSNVDSNSNVQVVVRIRPPNSREKENGYFKCVKVDESKTSIALFQRNFPPRQFNFDFIADEDVQQEAMFTYVGKPITDSVLQGYHGCLLAYGQTGTGKTYTMQGPDSDSSNTNRGLIPQIFDYLFLKLIEEKQTNERLKFEVKCSYLQIYNEHVSDLLEPSSNNLNVREKLTRGTYVEGLKEFTVNNCEQSYELFKLGMTNREVGITAMNLESSRSHSVFILTVKTERKEVSGVMKQRISRLYLVDLAGSERQKHSEATGLRLKEAANINRSLSALGNVIKSLVESSDGKTCHIPYRESKLTFLLRDALGGNSKCTLIANLSPAESSVDESACTLGFAHRARSMRNCAKLNEEDLICGMTAESMAAEIRRLRLHIASMSLHMPHQHPTDVNQSQDLILNPSLSSSSSLFIENDSESEKVQRLKTILSQSVKLNLSTEQKLKEDINVSNLKIESYEDLINKLEYKSQCLALIIRLKEENIKRIKRHNLTVHKNNKNNENDENDENDENEENEENDEKNELLEEINVLKKLCISSPEIIKLKLELDLAQDRLDALEEERNGVDNSEEEMKQVQTLANGLRMELYEITEERKTLEIEKEKLKLQISSLQKQYEDSNMERMKTKNEYAKLLKEFKKLKEKFDSSSNECNQAVRNYDIVESKAAELAQDANTWKVKFENINSAFEQQTSLQEEMLLEYNYMTQQRDQAHDALRNLEKSNSELLEKILSFEKQQVLLESETKKCIAEKDEEIKRMRSDLREWEERFNQASDAHEREKALLQNSLRDAERGAREKEEAMEKLREWEERFNQASDAHEREKALLQNSLRDAERGAREKEEAMEKLREWEERFNQASDAHEREKALLQNSLRDAERGASEKEEAMEKLREWEERFNQASDAHEREKAHLQNSLRDAERGAKEKEEAMEKLRSDTENLHLSIRNQRLEFELRSEAWKDQVSTVEEERTALIEELSQKSRELQDAMHLTQEMEVKEGEYEKSIQTFREQVRSCLEEIKESKKQTCDGFEMMDALAKASESEISSLTNELVRKTSELNSVNGEVKRLSKKCLDLTRANSELVEQVREQNNSILASLEHTSLLERNIEHLRAELAKKSKTNETKHPHALANAHAHAHVHAPSPLRLRPRQLSPSTYSSPKEERNSEKRRRYCFNNSLDVEEETGRDRSEAEIKIEGEEEGEEDRMNNPLALIPLRDDAGRGKFLHESQENDDVAQASPMGRNLSEFGMKSIHKKGTTTMSTTPNTSTNISSPKQRMPFSIVNKME